MAIDFSKFNKIVDDLDGLKKDIMDAENGSNEYKDVPEGEYEVSIDKMELVESKKGDPMVSIWFKILEGEYKNSRLFMNQVVTRGFQIHIVNEFLKSLNTEIDVVFEDFVQYGNMILDIHEEISEKYEYAVAYGKNKGFNTFEITEVYKLED